MTSVIGALFVLISAPLLAQEDSGSAPIIMLEDYISVTFNGTACNNVSGNLGASGSGVAACAGVDNDDVWYRFNATTQAVKLEASTGDFDMVLEILDLSLAPVACENTYFVNGGETLYANNLVTGDDYFIRVHSADGAGAGSFDMCALYLPSCEVRLGWYPTKNTDLGLPGYRVNETINRKNYSPTNSLIEATRWLFIDVDNGDNFTTVVNGSNGILNLNDVGGICFDRTYDVYIEVQVDGGYWCGYSQVRQIFMEQFPTTELEPGYAGLAYNMTEDLKARYVGDGQNIEWRLTTDNGNTVLTHIGPGSSSLLYFEQVNCIRYNKIYTIEARAEYCGIWGPWSSPEFVILNPLPYVDVRDEFCNTTQFPGATVACDFLPVVDQYAWQIAPIATDDPEMQPVGPAIVTYTVGTTALYLLPLGLTDEQAYRFGVKSLIGLNDACDDEQQSDYGNFCQIIIGNPNFAPDGPNVLSSEYTAVEEMSSLTLFPNPATQSSFVNMSLKDVSAKGTAFLDVYDHAGRLILSEQVLRIQDANYLQFELPGQAQSGLYQVVLHGEGFKVTEALSIK